MKNGLQIPVSHFLAEDEGFEPPVPFSTLRFECSAFNHSANPPYFFLISEIPSRSGSITTSTLGSATTKLLNFINFCV